MASQIGKSITSTQMRGTEKPDQISLTTTEIGGSVKYLMGVSNPFRTDKENLTDPTIEPSIIHFKKVTVPGHSDWKLTPFGSFDSGTDVPRSRVNIDKRTGKNPKGTIVTTIPESNRSLLLISPTGSRHGMKNEEQK